MDKSQENNWSPQSWESAWSKNWLSMQGFQIVVPEGGIFQLLQDTPYKVPAISHHSFMPKEPVKDITIDDVYHWFDELLSKEHPHKRNRR